MNFVRGIRGATTADSNTSNGIIEATRELLTSMVESNDVDIGDITAIFFTTTPDLQAEFPPLAARQLGWEYVALINSIEMDVPGAQQKCIRILMLVNTEKSQKEIKFVYLKEAVTLRKRGVENS
tara:strand:- start:8955 stop:9326 length:372 start_codon:yes stop_codon:yes gene_type:complete